jgi:ATP-dependent RNA helicase RhlE
MKLYKFIPGHTKIVILVPTRELVVQVVEEVEKLTKYMSVRTVGIFWCYQYPKDYCLSRLRH